MLRHVREAAVPRRGLPAAGARLQAGRRLVAELGERGAGLEVVVSEIVTDPWTFVVGAGGAHDVPDGPR